MSAVVSSAACTLNMDTLDSSLLIVFNNNKYKVSSISSKTVALRDSVEMYIFVMLSVTVPLNTFADTKNADNSCSLATCLASYMVELTEQSTPFHPSGQIQTPLAVSAFPLAHGVLHFGALSPASADKIATVLCTVEPTFVVATIVPVESPKVLLINIFQPVISPESIANGDTTTVVVALDSAPFASAA